MSESFMRIAGRLNDLDERLRLLETYSARVQTPAVFWNLTALRGLWTQGQVDYQNPYCLDLAGGDYHLDLINAPIFGYDGAAPYIELDGVNQYERRLDGGAGNWADITGGETYVRAAQRGLTLGGWFKFQRLTNQELLIGKSTGVAAASSYHLVFRGDLAGDPIRFVVSTGAAFVSATVTPVVATASWVFVAGRYDPGAELKVYAGIGDGSPVQTGTNAVGVPAALPDTASDFTIGSYSGGASYLDGRASFCFLCAAMLSDAAIASIYSQTRALYGV